MQHTLGWRIGAFIKKHQFDHAADTSVIQGHFAVQMPTFDHSRINYRKVDFTKSFKQWIVTAQHVHDFAALIIDLIEPLYDYAVYCLSHSFYFSLIEYAILTTASRALRLWPRAAAKVPHL